MMDKRDIAIASNMAIPAVQPLRHDPDLTIDAVQKGTLYYLAMSMKDDPFANPQVREAVRYLVDYQGINKTLMAGYGTLHQRPIQSGMPETLPAPGYRLDAPRAKALLAAAG